MLQRRQVAPGPYPVPEPGKGTLSSAKGSEGEVHPVPIADGEAEVAEGEGVEAHPLQVLLDELVAGRLGHLDAVGQQVLAVHPISDKGLPKGRLALGNLVLVVREYVVHAPGMEVQLLAHVFGRHGGALYVPAGKPLAPGTVPLHLPAGLRRFPQGEVPGVPLQGVGFCPDALHQPFLCVARELAVVGELANVEVDVVLNYVGEALLEEALNDGDHLWDVVGGPGEVVGRQDVQPALVPVEDPGVVLGDLLGGPALGEGCQDDLVSPRFQGLLAHVAYVGDVLDMGHAVAPCLQSPS